MNFKRPIPPGVAGFDDRCGEVVGICALDQVHLAAQQITRLILMIVELKTELVSCIHMDDFSNVLVCPCVPNLVAPRLFDGNGQVFGAYIHDVRSPRSLLYQR